MCWLIWKYAIYVGISIPWQINVYRETGTGHSQHSDEGWKHLANTTLCIIFWFSHKCHQDCLHMCRHNANLPLQWSGQWSRSRRGGLGWWLRPGWSAGSSCSCRHTQTDSTWGSALHGTARRTTLCKKRWDRGGGWVEETTDSQDQFLFKFGRQQRIYKLYTVYITGLSHHSRDPLRLWRWHIVSSSSRRASGP